MPHTGSRGLAFGQPFIASAQKEMSHAGVLREFGVSARLHGILLLSVPSSGVKVVHASTFAFVCAWIGRRHDELHCAMVFKKPGFGGRHKLVRPRIIHAVDDKRRRRPMRKIGPGCQNNTTLSVGYSREGSKADGVNPSEAVREHQASAARVCNVPFREHQASAVLSCNCLLYTSDAADE